MGNPFDQFDSAEPGASGNPFDQFDSAPPAKKQNKGLLSDYGTDLKRGIQQLPGIATGILDIPIGAATGEAYASKAADALGEITGFQPSKWAKDAQAEYSPERQRVQQEINQAWDGAGDAWDKAKEGDYSGIGKIGQAYLKNPAQAIGGAVVESLPSMLAGGIAGRSLATGAKAVSPVVGAGIGEGSVMAGQQMDQLTQTGADARTAAAASAITGVVGGGISVVGGKAAQALGVVDPETALAGGATRAVANQAADKTVKGAIKEGAKRVAGGALSEGFFEELPQSVLEQALSNLAQGKPWDEGVARAAVEGTLAGSVMGGAFNVLPGREAEAMTKPAGEQPADQQAPMLALPAPTYTGTPGDQIIANDVERQAAIDKAQAESDAIWAARDEYERQQAQYKQRPMPIIINDPEPIQQRIDALMGISESRLKGAARTNYEKALENAFAEQVGWVVGKDDKEVPFTMGDYLKSKVAIADLERKQPVAQSPAAAPVAEAPKPEIPVVGPLSAVANMAVQSGAAAPAIAQPAAGAPVSSAAPMQNVVQQAGGQSNAAVPEQVAQKAPQANGPQAGAEQGTAPAGAGQFNVSTRTEPQLIHLSLKGQPGWKEAAVAELQRRQAGATNESSGKHDEVKTFAPETGTLGIPRAEMPQVQSKAHGGLVKHINAQGIAHETTTVAAGQLKPTQAEFIPAKVEAAKNANGDRAVIVSNDGYIIDGHHQALAAAEDGKDVKAIVLDAPVAEALEVVKNSPSANVSLASKGDTQQSAESKAGKPLKSPTQGGPEDSIGWSRMTVAEREGLLIRAGYGGKGRALNLGGAGAINRAWDNLGKGIREKLIAAHEAQFKSTDQKPIKNETPDAATGSGETKAPEQEAVKKDDGKTRSLENTASWVIKNKETGEILFETFDKAKVDALNTEKYEAVPILAHLQSLNKGLSASPPKTDAATESKQDKAPAITPQHVENGEAEPATSSVVEQSLKKGAANSPLDLRQERDLLLKKIDAAIAEAPSAAEKDAWDRVNQKIDLKNNMHVEETIGYRAFDVPGDGKFKVLNLKEALQRFRDRVEANPGFRKPINEKPKTVADWQRTTTGGTEATTKELLTDGEYSAAVEYAKQIGKPLVFGQYQDGSDITVYTEAKPFEREGYDDFNMVSVRAFGAADKVAWAVVDLNSGLTISSKHPTRLKAIAETNKALAKTTPGQLAAAVRSANDNASGLVGTQAELEQRWLANVEQREAEAQAKADQEHRKTLRSHRGMLADHTGKPADESGKAETPDVEFDAKARWESMTPSQRFSMLDTYAGAGQTDMGGRYKNRSWDSFNVGEQSTLRAVLQRLLDDPAADMSRNPGKTNTSQERVEESAKNEQVDTVDAENPAVQATSEPAATAEAPASLLDRINATVKKLYDGELTVEELRASFALARDNRAAIEAELSKLTKAELLHGGGAQFAYRYKNDTKPEIVKAAYGALLDNFIMGESISYAIGGRGDWIETKARAIQARVDSATPESLAAYAEKIKANRADRERRREAVAKAIADPQTLEDYRRLLQAKVDGGKSAEQARMELTPEQRITLDNLWAEDTRQRRADRKEAAKTDVQAAAKTTSGDIIETKHTKTGEPLFVVKAAERVERDVYNEWNAEAKKRGGYYSSYKGGGAIPGFTFKSRKEAESFLEFLVGVNPSADKGAPHGVVVDAEALSDLVDSESFRVHGFGGLNVKAQGAVLSSMRRLAQNDEILGSIVLAIPVDVMNILVREQITPKDFLHNEAMLRDALSGNGVSGEDISLVSMNGFVRAAARAATEVVGRSGNGSFGLGKDDSALLAGNANLRAHGGMSAGSATEQGATAGNLVRGFGDATAAVGTINEGHVTSPKSGFAQVDEAVGAASSARILSQSAVERLNEMADRLEERADESLGRERKANTARRARFAASAEAAANSDKALAKTMRNIADAIASGTAKFLDRVRQKAQVEMLRSTVRSAQYSELQKKYPSYVDQEKHRGEKPSAETADFARWPTFTADRADLARLARDLLQIDGAKLLGQRILKVADDVTDAYQKFAKDNLHKVSVFSMKRDGDETSRPAVFPTADKAESAIARSGYKGKATTISFKRGEHLVIMGPEMAREAGLWQGDPDKRITLTAEVGEEIVAKVKALGKGKVAMPYVFESVAAERARWKAMGIETAAEQRAALREFIALQEAPEAPDRIKELERAMVGRANDGLDFFPTPAETAQAMIEAADIKEGMAVLEPSAGMGHIAEQIRDVAGVDPDVAEFSSARRELLEAKGFNVVGQDFMDMTPRDFTYGDVFRAPDGTLGVMRGYGGLGSGRVGLDFLDANGQPDRRRGGWYDRDELVGVEKRAGNAGYDRIIMNPPFSNRRDAEHVQHAYSLLKPGGRLVAIMGEGVFYGQDNKAKEFRGWLETVGGTSEKLESGTFMDPSLPVNTSVNARMVVIEKPAGAVSPDSESVGNIADSASLSPADKAVYGMVADGKSAADILKFIASASRNPFYRQVAKLLLKTGIAPNVVVGTAEGWRFNAGNDKRYAAAYNPKTDTVALFRAAAAERNVLHEMVHAATLRALGKKGMAAGQLRALFKHVQDSGKLRGMYGMTDVDEFIAEAFSNPKFQDALKQVSAPAGSSTLASAWHWFIRIVRGILGLPADQDNALSRAIEIGLDVMREDMRLRQQMGKTGDPRQSVPTTEITGTEIERAIGRTIQEKATNWMRANLQGKAFTNDATGWEISIGRKGINKTMNHGAKALHARSVAALPGMLKHAVLVSSQPVRHAADSMDVFAVHHFYAPFSIDGEMHLARMVVKETRAGQKFYDYDTSDVISPAKPGADAILPKEGAATGNNAGPTISMATLLSHVKAEHGGNDPRFAKGNESAKAQTGRIVSADRDVLAKIFAGLDSRGLTKDKAEAAMAERGDAEQIQYIQDNFIDILAELEDAGAVEINCD